MGDKASKTETNSMTSVRGKERRGRNIGEGCNLGPTKDLRVTQNPAEHSYSPALNRTPIRPQYNSHCLGQKNEYFILGNEMHLRKHKL